MYGKRECSVFFLNFRDTKNDKMFCGVLLVILRFEAPLLAIMLCNFYKKSVIVVINNRMPVIRFKMFVVL